MDFLEKKKSYIIMMYILVPVVAYDFVLREFSTLARVEQVQ